MVKKDEKKLFFKIKQKIGEKAYYFSRLPLVKDSLQSGSREKQIRIKLKYNRSLSLPKNYFLKMINLFVQRFKKK